MESRQDLLCKINEVSFAVNDLTLFLDTHPTDPDALNLFEEYQGERKNLLQQFESEYEPLTIDTINVANSNHTKAVTEYPDQRHFNWVDGPLPWEGGLA